MIGYMPFGAFNISSFCLSIVKPITCYPRSCAEIPHAGGRVFERGDEEFLRDHTHDGTLRVQGTVSFFPRSFTNTCRGSAHYRRLH
jgi:hypothetical protein